MLITIDLRNKKRLYEEKNMAKYLFKSNIFAQLSEIVEANSECEYPSDNP